MNLAEVYMLKEEYDKAMQYINRAKSIKSYEIGSITKIFTAFPLDLLV